MLYASRALEMLQALGDFGEVGGVDEERVPLVANAYQSNGSFDSVFR